jgi:acetylornithine aminotransferase
VCAAALATFGEIERCGLLSDVKRKGELFSELLRTIDEVQEVRGAGLMIGAVLKKPIAFSVVSVGLERGLVLNATSDSVLRFVPPLVISDDALVEAVATLKKVIGEVVLTGASPADASKVASW